MKITVIISAMLIAQVSAAFFDVFQGAVLSVQNSFGKLFNDVVTDVKDTVDCTILAVEHVLSLSQDATARYYEKCGRASNGTVTDKPKEVILPTVEISISNNEEYLKKVIPEEIDARINATLSRLLNGYNPHDKLEDVEKGMAKETERLANVSELVKQELEKLSNVIYLDLKNVERNDSKPSVDSILEQLKILEAIEQNIRNTPEAKEIHRLIDDVLHKLNTIEAADTSANAKVEGILKDLEDNSNSSYTDLRQQITSLKAEEERHIELIKSKLAEHDKIPEHIAFIQSSYFNHTLQPNSNINGINSSTAETSDLSLHTEPSTIASKINTTYNQNIVVKTSDIPLNVTTARPKNDTVSSITQSPALSTKTATSITTNFTNHSENPTTPPVGNTQTPSAITESPSTKLAPSATAELPSTKPAPSATTKPASTKLAPSATAEPPSTKPAPSATTESLSSIQTPYSTTESPSTIPAPSATAEPPSTKPAPSATTEPPSTKLAPSATTEPPSTKPAPSATTELPSTKLAPSATTEPPSTKPAPSATTEPPSTKPAPSATVETPSTKPAPSATAEPPSTKPARSAIIESLSSIQTPYSTTESPSTIPAPSATAEPPSFKPAPSATTEPPSTKPAPSATTEPPSTKPAPSATTEPPSTKPALSATVETPSTKPLPSATAEPPSTKPARSAITESLSSIQTPYSTTESPSTKPAPSATAEPPSTKPAPSATAEPPSTKPAPSATAEPPSTKPAPSATAKPPSTKPAPSATAEPPSTKPAPSATAKPPSTKPAPSATAEPPSTKPAPSATAKPPSTKPAPSVTAESPSTKPAPSATTESLSSIQTPYTTTESNSTSQTLPSTTESSSTTPNTIESSTIPGNVNMNSTMPTTTTVSLNNIVMSSTTEIDILISTDQYNNTTKLISSPIPMQTNVALKSTTPVAITTSSYANENNHETPISIEPSILTTIRTTTLNPKSTIEVFESEDPNHVDQMTLKTTTLPTIVDEDETSTTMPTVTTAKISKQLSPSRADISDDDTNDNDTVKITTPAAITETTHIGETMANKDVGISSTITEPMHSSTHRSTASTPSLNDFLSYIDRIVSVSTTTTQAAPIAVQEPPITMPPVRPYSEPPPYLKSNSPLPAVSTGLLPSPRFMPPQNVPPPYARNIPLQAPVNMPIPPGHMAPPRLMPLAYNKSPPYPVSNPTVSMNRILPPPPRLAPPQRGYKPNLPSIQPPNNINNSPSNFFNRPPMSMDVRPVGLTTQIPLSTLKTNNFDDPDYDSFFHTPSKDTDAHARALREARQLMADSKRSHRIMDSILNGKRGRRAFGLPNALKFGK